MEYSNEALALSYQQGDRSALCALWEQNKGLLYQQAFMIYQKYRERCDRSGVTVEDMQQVLFFAIESAAKAYNPAKGYKFTSYLKFPIMNEFRRLMGLIKPEPLDNSSSLNETAGENFDDERESLIPDPSAEQAFVACEDSIQQKQLHKVLERAMNSLPENRAQVLKYRYFDGLTLKECGKQSGISLERSRQLERDGLRRLRSPEVRRILEPFLYDDADCYRGTGLRAWNECGSVQERIMIHAEQKLKRHV